MAERKQPWKSIIRTRNSFFRIANPIAYRFEDSDDIVYFFRMQSATPTPSRLIERENSSSEQLTLCNSSTGATLIEPANDAGVHGIMTVANPSPCSSTM